MENNDLKPTDPNLGTTNVIENTTITNVDSTVLTDEQKLALVEQEMAANRQKVGITIDNGTNKPSTLFSGIGSIILLFISFVISFVFLSQYADAILSVLIWGVLVYIYAMIRAKCKGEMLSIDGVITGIVKVIGASVALVALFVLIAFGICFFTISTGGSVGI